MARRRHIVISVNGHNIRRNAREGSRRLPPIRVESPDGDVTYSHGSELVDIGTGRVLARLVYDPDQPLSCGARLYLELSDGVLVTLPDPRIDHTGAIKEKRR
jgi:hypothetical protein